MPPYFESSLFSSRDDKKRICGKRKEERRNVWLSCVKKYIMLNWVVNTEMTDEWSPPWWDKTRKNEITCSF